MRGEGVKKAKPVPDCLWKKPYLHQILLKIDLIFHFDFCELYGSTNSTNTGEEKLFIYEMGVMGQINSRPKTCVGAKIRSIGIMRNN